MTASGGAWGEKRSHSPGGLYARRARGVKVGARPGLTSTAANAYNSKVDGVDTRRAPW
jgi:hypothetical protein